MEDPSSAVANRRPALGRVVLVLDVLVAVALLSIVASTAVHSPTAGELANLDPEAASLQVFTPIILVPFAGLFAIAGIGHWRRYAWRWPVQWVVVILICILAAFVLASFVLS